jgi:phosphate-selective porin OprO and OprP
MTSMLRQLVCASVVAVATGTVHAQDWPEVDFGWGDHPSMKIGDVRLELAARAETDARLATPAVGRDRGELSWGDPRIEVRGRVTRRVDFEVSREFGDDAAWKDAFLNIRVTRALEIEAGRFKIPFGRETLVGRANLDFIHRSLGASQLAPSRDAGVMVHGRLLGRRLRYQAGVFERDGDNARTSQALGGRRTMALRFVAAPLPGRSGENDARLQIGIAMTRSRVDDRLGLRGRTLMEDGIFFDRVYVNGSRRRTGLEAHWVAGSASVAAEFMQVSDERNDMGFRGEDLPAVHASAWYLAGTWAITGERKDGRLEPRRSITAGGVGSLELVARLEELRFAGIDHPGSAFNFPGTATSGGNADRLVTVGVNWYLTPNVRLQHNYAIERVATPGRSPAPTRDGRIRSAIFRLQLTV